jgi:hypothetical protein
LIYLLEHGSSKMLSVSMVANGSQEKFAGTERSVSQLVTDSSCGICCSRSIVDHRGNSPILEGRSRNRRPSPASYGTEWNNHEANITALTLIAELSSETTMYL